MVEARVETKTPTPVPLSPPKPVVQADSVKDRVLALVAEKTGYPVDMLDLDLDLEADLGIDTVKQAEVMATIRQAYGIVRDDAPSDCAISTLARVIQFVHDRAPQLRAAPVAATSALVSEHAPKAEGKAEHEIKVAPPVAAAAPAPIAVAKTEADAVKDRILTHGREDGLPAGHARPGSRSRSRPRRRYREARQKCLRRFVKSTTSPAMKTVNSAITPRWRT
jgi:acyl carrier protein